VWQDGCWTASAPDGAQAEWQRMPRGISDVLASLHSATASLNDAQPVVVADALHTDSFIA